MHIPKATKRNESSSAERWLAYDPVNVDNSFPSSGRIRSAHTREIVTTAQDEETKGLETLLANGRSTELRLNTEMGGELHRLLYSTPGRDHGLLLIEYHSNV